MTTLDKQPKWRRIEIARKGGSVKSDKKKFSAKIRAMRQYGIRNKDLEWIKERIDNPKSSLWNIIGMIDRVRDLAVYEKADVKTKGYVTELYMKAHRLAHGDRVKVSGEININVADRIADKVIDKIIDADFEEIKDKNDEEDINEESKG